MKLLFWFLCVAAVFIPTGELSAQARWYGARGYGGYGGYGGVGTAASSNMQGMSQMISAQGEKNYNDSLALRNYEDARSAYIDNQYKFQQTYRQMKRDAEGYRSELQAKDYEKYQKFMAKGESGAPAQLSPSQVDFVTGQISWPKALTGPDYEVGRRQVEDALLLRAHTSGGSQSAGQIADSAKTMQDTLKGNVRMTPPSDYISARKFLDSLIYQMQQSS